MTYEIDAEEKIGPEHPNSSLPHKLPWPRFVGFLNTKHQHNLTEKFEKQKDEQTLVEKLDDATKFSYIATCAITLRELYYDYEEDRSFCINCLEKLLKHLKLPKQVENTSSALFEGQGCNTAEPFVASFRNDETLEELGLVAIPQDLVNLAVTEGAYDSRHRMLNRRIAEILKIPWEEVDKYEQAIALSLRQEDYEQTEEEKKEKSQRAWKSKFKRGAFIGLATVGGGVLLGVTGGLAAPLVAAGVGTVIGAGSAAVLGSTVGLALIGSLFGVAGASLGGYKMNKRVGNVEEFCFEVLTSDKDMHLTITVAGWLTKDKPDCKEPWKNLQNSGEQYTLKYETKQLQEMGQGIDYLMKMAVNAAVSEALKYTILSSLLAAIAWPAAILSASNVIDNPWGVCSSRTVQVGKQLAEVLLSRQQGKRPVTLVGFSLGARVVFYCLRELASRKKSLGIVEDAIMLGAPVTASAKTWKLCGKVVAGRMVNGFSSEDWLLKFLYRTASAQMTVAGLQPIAWCDRKMVNVDLSNVVASHTDYREKLDYLMTLVGLKVKQDNPEDSLLPRGLAGNVLTPGSAARIQGVKKEVRASTIPFGVEELDVDGKSKVKVSTPVQEESGNEYLQIYLVEDVASKSDVAGPNAAYDAPFNDKEGVKNNTKGDSYTKLNVAADEPFGVNDRDVSEDSEQNAKLSSPPSSEFDALFPENQDDWTKDTETRTELNSPQSHLNDDLFAVRPSSIRKTLEQSVTLRTTGNKHDEPFTGQQTTTIKDTEQDMKLRNAASSLDYEELFLENNDSTDRESQQIRPSIKSIGKQERIQKSSSIEDSLVDITSDLNENLIKENHK